MPATVTVLPVPTFLSAKVAEVSAIGEDVACDAVVGEGDGGGVGPVVDLVAPVALTVSARGVMLAVVVAVVLARV